MSRVENLKALVAAVRTLDEADLRVLSNSINKRFTRIQEEKAEEFRIGDLVYWEGKRGKQRGRVIKVNRVTVHVKADTGVTWRVSPQLLRLVGKHEVA